MGDVLGDGVFSDQDLAVISAAMSGRRGDDLLPLPGFDYRADVLGRGAIDQDALAAAAAAHDRVAIAPEDVRARPITVAWHYGWYNHAKRRPKKHHVWFKGGGYSSRDPQTEGVFNELKNEFGITVDALSWADPDRDGNLNQNLELGYLNAPNGDSRCAALLYESLISLKPKRGQRVNFAKRKVRKRLEKNFEQMAEFLLRLEDSGVRTFKVHQRPVIFLYASHNWGLDPMGPGQQHDLVDRAVEDAIAAFAAVYGSAPFLVGEEFTFVETDRFDGAHRRRAVNFDGVFNYHHAATPEFRQRGGQHLRGTYVDLVKEVYTYTYDGIAGLRNRFTNQKIVAVPSLAAGFSKRDEAMLHASTDEYTAFLREMLDHHEERFMVRAFGRSYLDTTPAIVSVGSWNEEWEGHAVMPARFNHTVAPFGDGFDYVNALKQVFGWNHYAVRTPPPVL